MNWLLETVIAQATSRGQRATSLTVEDGNRAGDLYQRAGFPLSFAVVDQTRSY